MACLTPLDLIGNTPLVSLKKLSKKYNCNIYLKLEKYNLSQSCKDRAVKEMLLNALKSKKINQHSTIIEPTSGNTGIALASICAFLSLKCIIIMPSNANEERKKLISSYGAKIILTDSKLKMKGCLIKTKELLKKINNSYTLSQFTNIDNYNANYYYTSKEIINDLPNIDGFFASFGTGGSISGISKALKEYNKNIHTIALKPRNKKHIIDGVFSNIKSKNFKTESIDKIINIDDVDSVSMVKYVAKHEGITIGLSSGLAIMGAVNYLKKHHLKNIVIYCSDGLERYLSNKYLFNSYKYDKETIEKDIEYIKKALFNSNLDYTDTIWFKYNLSSFTIDYIKKTLLLDAKAILLNDPAAKSINEIIDVYPGFFAIFVHRIANYLWHRKKYHIARIMSEYANFKTSIDIHPNAKIGTSFCIDHGNGIVIGQSTIIGNNVRLYQNVTLGALSLNEPLKYKGKKRHPTIKNDVIIYANATILGAKTIIGNNVIIGSNVFLTKSIEDNKIVVFKNNNYTIKENENNGI